MFTHLLSDENTVVECVTVWNVTCAPGSSILFPLCPLGVWIQADLYWQQLCAGETPPTGQQKFRDRLNNTAVQQTSRVPPNRPEKLPFIKLMVKWIIKSKECCYGPRRCHLKYYRHLKMLKPLIDNSINGSTENVQATILIINSFHFYFMMIFFLSYNTILWISLGFIAQNKSTHQLCSGKNNLIN